MHIVKVKQYDRAFAVKSKSSSHPYLSSSLVPFPRSNCYYQLITYPSKNILSIHKYTLLFRMIHGYLHICTHICIQPTKQNSRHHVIKPVLLLCFPLLIVVTVFHCKEGISFIQLVLLMAHLI